MVSKSILRTMAIMAAISATLSAGAQQKIEKLMEQLKNSKDVKLTYSERRDPTTHEIIKSSYVLTSTDQELFKKFMDAIQAERPKSIHYSEVDGAVFNIKFQTDDNGEEQSYSLIKQTPGNSWLFSTSKKSE